MRERDHGGFRTWPGCKLPSSVLHDRTEPPPGHGMKASDDQERELHAGVGVCGDLGKHTERR
jgi:hypothetical protein